MNESVDESALQSRAIAGDGAAIAFLLLRHEEQLLAYIRRRMPPRLQPHAAPEDVLQEVSVEACRMLPSFTPQGHDSLVRWLQVIARNRILELLRRQRRRRTFNILPDAYALDALDFLASHRRSPSASAAAHEFAFSVERSINHLRPDYQTVLTLRFLKGLSVEQTAAQMERSTDATYQLVSRALKSLRVHLRSESRWR